MSTVTGFTEGWTNTSRFPYALANLSCGHVASVVMRPNRGACCTCGTELDLPSAGHATCCGRSSFTHVKPYPNPHVEADRLTKVGDVVDCTDCQREREQEAWLRALTVPVHHARFRYGSYHLYRLEPISPSNFMLIGSVAPTPAIEAILREKRISPLSPTEPA